MGNIDYTKNPLVKKFIEVETNENKVKNIFLYAGGGYGKTTAMCCLFKYLLNKASNGEKFVPIYIDVKKLNFNKPNPIISYIHSKYSGSDTQESDVENLFSDQAPEFSKKYTYYILIDGLNETNDGNKGNLIDIISDMTQISNIRFVVSSRIKEIFDKAPFYVFELQKLNEEQIKDYLDKNFGKKYNEQTEVKRINKSLIEILQIPMFMKTFSKTYDKRSPYPDIYDEKTVRKADILDSYVQKILLNLKERTNSYDNNILEFVINFYLPALAFQMAEENVLEIDSEIADKKLCLDYFLSFFKGTKNEQIKSLINNDKFMPISISSKNFALINDYDGNYSFVHQIWRDFFAAKHIINCMNVEKLDELEISVDENIRQFVGELVREYVDKYKYSQKPAYKSIFENGKVKFIDNLDTRKCECDFEEKDNLETWSESPIEHFMQQHNMNSEKPISPMTTRNLIEIMKTCRNNCITSNYSCLNLCECQFRFSNLENSMFLKVKFNDSTFFINQLYNEWIVKSYCSPKGTILFLTSRNKIVVNKFNGVFEYSLKGVANEVDCLIFDDNDKTIIYTIKNTIYAVNTIDSNTWQYSIKKPAFCKLFISGNTKTIVGVTSEKCREVYISKNCNFKFPIKDIKNIKFDVYLLSSHYQRIDLSYDGKYIAIGTRKNELNIICYSDNSNIMLCNSFDCNYSDLAFSYDNKRIVIAYSLRILEFYDFSYEKLFLDMKLSIKTKSRIESLDFDNVRNTVVYSNNLEIISLDLSGNIEKCLWESIDMGCEFALTENENLIFSDNNFIRVLDLNSMKIINSIKHNCSGVLSISNDGMYFLSQHLKKALLEIYDLNTNIYCSLPIDSILVRDADFSAKNMFYAYRYSQLFESNGIYGWDNAISIVNNNSSKKIADNGIKTYTFSNDGNLFAYVDEKGCLIILDSNSLKTISVVDDEFAHIAYFDEFLILLVNTKYELVIYDIELHELSKVIDADKVIDVVNKFCNLESSEIVQGVLKGYANTLIISKDLSYSCFYANGKIHVNDKFIALNCSSNINGCIFKNVNYIGSYAKSFFKSLYQYGAKLAKNELINAIEEPE